MTSSPQLYINCVPLPQVIMHYSFRRLFELFTAVIARSNKIETLPTLYLYEYELQLISGSLLAQKIMVPTRWFLRWVAAQCTPNEESKA